MAEVTYTAGYNFMSNVGKGKAILGMYVTSASTSDTISTPFARCVTVVTPAVGCDATSVINVTEAAGVVTIAGAGTQVTGYNALIVGDLH